MPTDVDDHKMPLLDHLVELRNRLVYSVIALLVAFAISYFFAADLFAFLVHPLAEALNGESGRRLIYTGLTEAFFTYVKVAFFAAMFLSFPVIAIQVWMFVAPGLYKHEKRAFLPFLVATPILFFLGGALAYYFIFPLAWKFFVSFETAGAPGLLPIQLEAKVNEYLSLAMRLIFAFGLSFELPVLLTLMARVGLVTSKGLASKRKYALIIVFIVAAVLTPPDVISQIGLAVPILLLYEISILAVRMVEKRRGAGGDMGDDDPDGGDDPGSDNTGSDNTGGDPGGDNTGDDPGDDNTGGDPGGDDSGGDDGGGGAEGSGNAGDNKA